MPQVEVTFDIDANGIVNVSAKDLGTGKEQKITITASSGLDERDIEKMVKDADSHREEDKQRRSQVEARNRLDGLVYTTEKTLGEHQDKVSPEHRADLERAIADARKALEGEDTGAMEQAEQQLNQASHKLAEAMYRQPTGDQAAGGPEGGAASGGPEGGPGAAGEEVIDAEYVDVDDRNN
jgi:molecular chaperone DnaK